MLLKSSAILAPLMIGGAYATGAFDSSYSREVDRPMPQVMAALVDLDIREQPGQPGTDPSRAGGVTPVFLLERTAQSMTWKVMSGRQVATSMTVTFEPLDGGKRTRVTAEVERGDASDDFVSPAFRSEGLTLALFSMAVEGELNELTRPAADPAKCRELMERFEGGAFASVGEGRPSSLKEAVGSTAATGLRLGAFEAELRRNGCDTDSPAGEFTPVESMMGRPSGMEPSSGPDPDVNFEAGKPMVDVRANRPAF